MSILGGSRGNHSYDILTEKYIGANHKELQTVEIELEKIVKMIKDNFKSLSQRMASGEGVLNQKGIDFIKNVGGADTSKDVAEDKRQACIDAMTKFAEENKISL